MSQFLSVAYIVDEENSTSLAARLILAGKQVHPFLYGLFGALTYLLRSLHSYIAERTFDVKRVPEYYNRMSLGFIGGGVVLLFFDPKSAGVGADALAFVVGYNTDTLFDLLERVASTVVSKSKDGGAPSKPGVAKVSASPKDPKPGGNGTATVTLKSSAPAEGVIVALSADAALTVPSTVIVTPGSNSAQFTFNVKDGAKGKASITATANGSSASDDVQVS